MLPAIKSKAMLAAKLDIERQPGANGTVITRLVGKLSLETVRGFLQTLRAEDAPKVVLDMSGLTFLDSSGVGALVQIFVHRRSKSQEFVLAALTAQGIAVMQVSGLVKLMPICATVEEATK